MFFRKKGEWTVTRTKPEKFFSHHDPALDLGHSRPRKLWKLNSVSERGGLSALLEIAHSLSGEEASSDLEILEYSTGFAVLIKSHELQPVNLQDGGAIHDGASARERGIGMVIRIKPSAAAWLIPV